VATWNVRGIINKEDELELELLNRKIDIAIISETKKKEQRIKRIKKTYNDLLGSTRGKLGLIRRCIIS
jgi:exonuclease III